METLTAKFLARVSNFAFMGADSLTAAVLLSKENSKQCEAFPCGFTCIRATGAGCESEPVK